MCTSGDMHQARKAGHVDITWVADFGHVEHGFDLFTSSIDNSLVVDVHDSINIFVLLPNDH